MTSDSGHADAAATEPLATVTYTESKVYVMSGMGGLLLISTVKAYLFRFDHPDTFFQVLSCLTLAVIVLFFWLPPKLALSAERVRGTSFGFTWIDVPWAAIVSIEMFRTPVVKTMGAQPTGGQRAIGFTVKAEDKVRIRPRSGSYGYDAVIVSVWNFSIDTVAEQCLARWHARGGAGELVSRLESYKSDQLQLGA